MRNLKKILALVLALVMSLSLVTMANADFTDAAEIEHKEAVEVMAAAGVLAGLEDGSFNPNGTLTRAQAAKIVAYVLLGEEPAAVTGASFSDVPASHWAAGSIAYVAGKGIVSGNGDGTFSPNGQLTGYAFAKMLLGALEIEGSYTGLGWEVNVADAAEDADLLEKLDDVALGNPLSREHAAQMALNAMMYTDSEDAYRIIVDGKDVDFDNEKDALLYAAIGEGTYVGKVANTEGSLIDEVFEIAVDTGVDAYGRVATTYDHEDWAAVLAYGEAADYTYVVDEDTTVEDLVSDKNLGKKIKAESIPEGYALRAGSVVELYVNDDKDLTNVVSYLYIVAEIESVEELDEDDYEDEIADGAKYMIEAAGEEMLDIQIANFDEKTYVEGAMIMVPVVYTITGAEDAFYPTYDKNFAEIGTEWVVVDTEINEGFEGKVDRKGTDYVRVDGTKYTMSNNTQDAIALGAEGTFYADANDFVIGFVAAKDAAATIDDVVYLVTTWPSVEKDKYGDETTTTYAQVVDLEGNVEELIVAIDGEDDYGVAPDAEDYGKLYTYATYTAKKVIDGVDYKGTSKLTLWEPEDVEEGEDPDYYLGNINGVTLTSDKTKAGNYRLNNSTVYILLDGTKADLEVTVKTGGVDTKAAAANSIVVAAASTAGNKIAKYVVLPGSEVDATNYDDVIYVDAAAEKENGTVADTDCIFFAAYNEAGKADVDVILAGSEMPDAGFYTYSIDEDGIYELTAITDLMTGDDALTAVYDDETGYVYGGYDSYYETLITLDETYLADIETKDAEWVDLHDKDDYSKTIDSLADLDTAKDKGYVAELDIYVADGAAVVIVVK